MPNSGLCRLGDHSVKKKKNQRKRKGRHALGPHQRTKNLWNMKVTMIPIASGALGTISKDNDNDNDWKTPYKKRGGRLITITRNNTDNTSINRTEITRKNPLHGHFKRQTNEISDEKTLKWLRKGNLKREKLNLF